MKTNYVKPVYRFTSLSCYVCLHKFAQVIQPLLNHPNDVHANVRISMNFHLPFLLLQKSREMGGGGVVTQDMTIVVATIVDWSLFVGTYYFTMILFNYLYFENSQPFLSQLIFTFPDVFFLYRIYAFIRLYTYISPIYRVRTNMRFSMNLHLPSSLQKSRVNIHGFSLLLCSLQSSYLRKNFTTSHARPWQYRMTNVNLETDKNLIFQLLISD